GLRVELVAHLRGVVGLFDLERRVAPVVAGTARPFGSVAKSRVALYADEVVVTRQLEEPVADLRFELERATAGLRPVLVLQVAKRLRGAVAVALEERGESIRGEAALLVQPPRQREVMEGDHRSHAVLVTGVEDSSVVRQLRPRELAFGRFYAGPFDAETKGVE